MNNTFKNKRVLVTGASRGIGQSIAEKFLEEGAFVYLNYFVSSYEPSAQENINAFLTRKETYKQNIETVHFDVSDENSVRNFFQRLEVPIDVIINNAGVVVDKDLSDRTYTEWQWTINTNLGGTFLISKYGMEHINQGGSIVNISSSNAIDCFSPESADYDASKAGIILTTRNFAKELAGRVRVNAIAPGWVNTEMNKQLDDDFVKQETESIYLKRFAEPEEIANVALFLASDKASFINGTVIKVDGGHG